MGIKNLVILHKPGFKKHMLKKTSKADVTWFLMNEAVVNSVNIN